MATGVKFLAKNKKAYFDYEIIEKYETGIVLNGAEVKSVKGGHVQMKGCYAHLVGGRVMVENMHISPYKCAPRDSSDPTRKRELLLRKKEIEILSGKSVQQGYTLIPLEMYMKGSLIKVTLGVCRGRKQHGKRDVLKGRAVTRDMMSGLKKFSR